MVFLGKSSKGIFRIHNSCFDSKKSECYPVFQVFDAQILRSGTIEYLITFIEFNFKFFVYIISFEYLPQTFQKSFIGDLWKAINLTELVDEIKINDFVVFSHLTQSIRTNWEEVKPFDGLYDFNNVGVNLGRVFLDEFDIQTFFDHIDHDPSVLG